jgi:hypothetical protein
MKNPRNGHRDFSSHEISELIARYRASGMGLERFAREQGIPPGRLHYWLYQKNPSRPPKHSPKRTGLVPIPVFQEVKVAGLMPSVAGWVAEISLPKGLTIRFSAAALPGWIGSVVQALQRPC